MKLKVRCAFVIEVEVSDDPEYHPHFDIEDNHCPGTGVVGRTLKEHIEAHEKSSTCWACALQGECEIVE